MDYELQHFLLVHREGTFTAAARMAGLSQPALSASIQRLEDALGGPLFHRGRRGAVLTDAGRALLPHARAARAAIEEGRRAVRDVLELQAGEVRIGAGATATTYLLPTRLAAWRREHPAIAVRLTEMTTAETLEAVHDGAIDLGIATRLPGDTRPWPVDEEHWLDDPLVLVQAPDEARRAPPFLTFVRGSPMRELLDRHFPEASIAMELGSIAAVKGNVAAGVGIALVPVSAVRHTIADGRLVEREDPRTPLHRRLVLVHRSVDRLSSAAAALRLSLLAG